MDSLKRKAAKIGITSLMIATLGGCGIKQNNDEIKNDDYVVEETVEDTDQDTYEESEVIYPQQSNDIEEVDVKPIINIQEHSDDEEVDLPAFTCFTFEEGYQSNNPHTYGDLKHATYVFVSLAYNNGITPELLDFLNYVPNVTSMDIVMDDSADFNIREIVDFSRFPDMENVSVQSVFGGLNRDKVAFLKDFNHIDNLEYESEEYDVYIDNVNADNITISMLNVYQDLSYRDLSRFKSITIDMLPYNAAIYFTPEQISDLRSKGVDVKINDEETFNMACNKINEIYNGLNITPQDTQEERVRKIVVDVIKRCEYDPDISNFISEDVEHSAETASFYKDGALYPVLEQDTQICGNMASITTALGRRAGLDVTTVIAPKHAFNVVKIGEYYYFLDVTGLEGTSVFKQFETVNMDANGNTISRSYEFEEKRLDELVEEDPNKVVEASYYLDDPTKYLNNESDISHHPDGYPNVIKIVEIPDDVEIKTVLKNAFMEAANEEIARQVEANSDEGSNNEEVKEEVVDLTEKRIGIKIDGKLIIIPLAVIGGVLLGAGLIKGYNHKKEMERRRRRRQLDEYGFDDYDYSSDDYRRSSRRRR